VRFGAAVYVNKVTIITLRVGAHVTCTAYA
jgi:hypothetical protein